jgi:hypothetical protein
MADILRFPHQQYQGDLIQTLMDIANTTGRTRHRQAETLYCEMLRREPQDVTGEYAQQCQARTDLMCVHCGPICRECSETFACCGVSGKHEFRERTEV